MKIIYELLGLLGIFLFVGCSDDIGLKSETEILPEGFLRIELAIPDAEVVRTKADNDSEKALKELTVFIYNENFSECYSKGVFEASDLESHSVVIPLPLNAKKSNLSFYAVANANSKLDDLNNPEKSDIQRLILGNNDLSEDNLILSGQAEYQYSVGSANVALSLKRVVAKMSMITEEVSGYKVEGFRLYNVASIGYVGANESGFEFTENSYKIKIPEEDSEAVIKQTYLYPSKGETTNDGEGAFLLIKAYKISENGNKDYFYYRTGIKADKENGVTENIDIKANHNYEIEIEEISGDGYSNEADAVKNSESLNITTKIHDHLAEIYSMTTDGVRELGAPLELITNDNIPDITIKCYSPEENELVIPPVISVIEGEDWLEVNQPHEPNYNYDMETSGTHKDDPNSKGYKWRCGLTKRDGLVFYSDKTALVRITWQGLKRDILIKYVVEFKPQTASYVNLIIKDSEGNDYKIPDYWEFIRQVGENKDNSYPNDLDNTQITNIPRLFGLSSESDREELADGKVRNLGFHFPVVYGEVGKLWEYEYEVDFSKFIGNQKINKIEISTKGSFFANNISWDYDLTTDPKPSKGVLKMAGGKDLYDYATGIVTFKIYLEGKDYQAIDLNLYHTGFFHYDKSDDSEDNWGYYYYEVVPMGYDSQGREMHWLDRNIGAKSNMMYVESSNISIGNTKAQGNYYTIAEPGDYSNPTFEKEKSVCPPGYHVPTATDWDYIRLDSKFKSERVSGNNENYFTTYYQSANPEVGKIYFPKVGFLNDDSPSGDNATGYYWSRTAATGLEKIQIGKWLKTLYLGGTSNTFMNGSIQDHKMNVRCISDGTSKIEEKYSIDFNVKGATHVYLYRDENGIKSGIFTFPGKAIGTIQAVKDHLQLFSYRSNLPANSLYVFFALEDEDGKIRVISKNKGENYSHDVLPVEIDNAVTTDGNYLVLNDIEGWPVWVGANYSFTWKEDLSGITTTAISMSDVPVSSETIYRLYYQYNEEPDLYVKPDGFGYDGQRYLEWGKHSEVYEPLEGWYYVEFSSNKPNGDITYKIGDDYAITGTNGAKNDVTVKQGLSYFSEPDEGVRHGWIDKNDVSKINPGKPSN